MLSLSINPHLLSILTTATPSEKNETYLKAMLIAKWLGY